MDSLLNNSKINLKNNLSCCIINKNINLNDNDNNNNNNINNNLNFKNLTSNIGLNNSFENDSKKAKIFASFEDTYEKNNIDANLFDIIKKNNTKGKILKNNSLQNAYISNNILNNISTNKNILIFNSSNNIPNEGNIVKNISFIVEKDKDSKMCFIGAQENINKIINTNINADMEDEMDLKNSATNLYLESKKNNEYLIAEEKKRASYDDLDDIVFPDKVNMQSFPLKKKLPILHLNFINKSVDLRKNKKVMDFLSNDYTDSYNIDLDNTSFIINDKSRARVIYFNFDHLIFEFIFL